jgi:hypothetical protein
VVPEPGEGMSLSGSSDLRARERSWASHYLTSLTFEPGRGAGQTPLHTYVNSQVPYP